MSACGHLPSSTALAMLFSSCDLGALLGTGSVALDPPTVYPDLYPTPASWQVLHQALCQGRDWTALKESTNHHSKSKNWKPSEFTATHTQQSIEEQNHDSINLRFEGKTSTGTNLFSALDSGYKMKRQQKQKRPARLDLWNIKASSTERAQWITFLEQGDLKLTNFIFDIPPPNDLNFFDLRRFCSFITYSVNQSKVPKQTSGRSYLLSSSVGWTIHYI